MRSYSKLFRKFHHHLFPIELQQTVHQQIRTDFRPRPQWVNSNENQPSQSSYISSMVKKTGAHWATLYTTQLFQPKSTQCAAG